MTLYVVEHTFSRPEWEEEWNAWYAANLKVLLAVPGFRTGQRFKAIEGTPPRYMAIYTVDSPDIFESPTYVKAGGGGSNSVRFRPAYQIWIRNLFEGIAVAPEVRDDEYLAYVDSVDRDVTIPGIELTWLRSTGFHKTTPYRAIGVLKQAQAKALNTTSPVILYKPITPQQGPLY